MDNSIDAKIKKIEEESLVVPIDVLLQSIDKLPSLNEEQCMKMLTVIPYKMEELEKKITSLNMILDEAVMRQKRLESLYKLKSIELKNRKELTSESDRTSWVMSQPEVQQAQDDVLKVKKEISELTPLFNRLDRNFTAIRKIASLINDSNNALNGSQKYI